MLHRARVQNLGTEPADATLWFSLRPYNPEGVALIHSIEYGNDASLFVDGRLAAVLTEEPDLAHCSTFRDGDCSFALGGGVSLKSHATCTAGLASAMVGYRLRLEPSATASKILVMPIGGAQPRKGLTRELRRFDYRDRKVRLKSVWEEITGQGMTVSLPDKEIEASFNLNKAYLALFDDGTDIKPGPLTYHHFWFRDAAFLVTALDRCGFTERAARILERYPSLQQKDGYFRSQNGEWDSNGQAIWTLMEHYRLTGDNKYLEKVFPAMGRAAYWIEKKRTETRAPVTPHTGLLPAGASAEHLGPNDYYYWDDFWGIAGLDCAAEAAELLGYRTEMLNFEKYRDDFKQSVHDSLRHASGRLGKSLLPASPYRRMDSGAIGSLACVYPLRIFSADDDAVTNTLDALRDVSFHKGCFFQHIVHAGINPYLTLHLAQVYLARRDPRAWDLATNVLRLATKTGTWPEAIHPLTGGGSMGDGHHGWALAEWLLFLRNALLYEEKRDLHLMSVLPSAWTEWGKEVSVKDAPTHFGRVSFRLESKAAELVLYLGGGISQPARAYPLASAVLGRGRPRGRPQRQYQRSCHVHAGGRR
ncbi:MAG: hypothetical protein M5R36_20630 [Deltaproteobacteria bacterium]|nr:hypothetical protein [Deltaproteobacteria bacterium]